MRSSFASLVVAMLCLPIICISAEKAARQSTPEIDDLIRIAEAQWKSSDYKNYVDTCGKLENLKPRFGVAYNVAAGLFMEGLLDDATKKLDKIEGQYSLSGEQKTAVYQLRTEILNKSSPDSSKYVRKEVIKTRSGSAILSKDFEQWPSSEIDRTKTVNRSAEALGLKPEQVGRYIDQQFKQGAEYNNFPWMPSPEPFEDR